MPFFERAGLKLHYFEAGQGPPVLLIHGWGGRARRQWHNTVLELQAGYHFYALELRGHGHSEDASDPSYDWAELVADCDALRAICGIDRWLVVGYSFGALVALQYAALLPRRVMGACAVSPLLLAQADKVID